MESSNRGLSMVSGVISLVGAIALVGFLMEPLDGRFFLAALGGGGLGALIGFLAGRSGANTWNGIGLWLGTIVVVACGALYVFLSPGEITTTEVMEVTEVPAE